MMGVMNGLTSAAEDHTNVHRHQKLPVVWRIDAAQLIGGPLQSRSHGRRGRKQVGQAQSGCRLRCPSFQQQAARRTLLAGYLDAACVPWGHQAHARPAIGSLLILAAHATWPAATYMLQVLVKSSLEIRMRKQA